MRKRDLKQIPVETLDRLDLPEVNSRETYITVHPARIKNEAVLLVNVYTNVHTGLRKITPEYRIFLHKYSETIYTEDLRKETKQEWTPRRPRDVMQGRYWGAATVCDRFSAKRASVYLNRPCSTGNDVRRELNNLWETYRQKKKREQEETAYRETMREVQVPPLPKDFKKFLWENALCDSRYIFYDTAKGPVIGYCTHCHRWIAVTPKHDHKGTCPACSSPVTFKANSKSKNIYDCKTAAVMYINKNDIRIRYFNVVRDFRKKRNREGDRPEIKFWEESRTINGIRYEYVWDENRKRHEWKKQWPSKKKKAVVYTGNLDSLQNTQYKYSGLLEAATFKKGLEIDAEHILYSENPNMEKAIKCGYISCAENMEKVPNGKETLLEAIGITKEQFKWYLGDNPEYEKIKALRKYNKAKIAVTKEQFEYLYRSGHSRTIIRMLKGTTVQRFIKFTKQVRKKDKTEFLSEWEDYLKMSEELGYDINNRHIRFPKELHTAHDRVIEEYTRQKTEIEAQKKAAESRKIAERAAEYEELYGYEDTRYKIVVPHSAKDIIREGREMHHCVGSYTGRVATGETTILFIRRTTEPDKPFYTMEIKGGRVIQNRGKYNQDYTPEIKKEVDAFVQKMLREYRKRIKKGEPA